VKNKHRMNTKKWRERAIFFLGFWAFMIIVASFVLLFSTEGINERYWRGLGDIALRGLLNFASYILIFSLVVEYFSKVLPWRKQLIKRIFANLAVIVATSFLFANINYNLGVPTRLFPNTIPFAVIFVVTFFQCGTILVVLEGWELQKRNRSLEVSLTQLEKEKLETQLLALRQQINPHFLFNSLNVLSELMHEDRAKADLFIQHFAKVYRYVLDINAELVVTLKQELDFLESYLFLQKIRFGENLVFHKNINVSALNRYLPPLSLQLLFENAVKHNTISTEHPLHICLKSKEDHIQLSNSYQMRSTKSNGTGIGLVNLTKKYQLLSEKEPEFFIQEEQYVATLPLLKID